MNDLCNLLTNAGREVLSCEDSSDAEWFETSKDELLPLINEINKLLLAARSSPNNLLKQKCIDTRNDARDTIKVAESR